MTLNKKKTDIHQFFARKAENTKLSDFKKQLVK